MSRAWRDSADEEAERPEPAVVEPDFRDERPGYAHGASAWGEPPRGGLEPMHELMDGVLGRLARPEQSTLDAVKEAWASAVGEAWKSACPVGVERETLVVEVPDGLTASRLQFDVTRVVGELRRAVGPRLVTIRFRVPRR
jgi:hypothetical protein